MTIHCLKDLLSSNSKQPYIQPDVLHQHPTTRQLKQDSSPLVRRSIFMAPYEHYSGAGSGNFGLKRLELMFMELHHNRNEIEMGHPIKYQRQRIWYNRINASDPSLIGRSANHKVHVKKSIRSSYIIVPYTISSNKSTYIQRHSLCDPMITKRARIWYAGSFGSVVHATNLAASSVVALISTSAGILCLQLHIKAF